MMKKKEVFGQNSEKGIEQKEQEMDKILLELRQKLKELDELKRNLEKIDTKKISAQKARQMLEEIVVPPLSIIKDQKKKM